ncbi:MAG: hypothetical protein ABIN89_15275 [Chitinophagaceae bacterium]
MKSFFVLLFLVQFIVTGFNPAPRGDIEVDIIIRNGMLYDGSGNKPVKVDIAISPDTITAIGNLKWYKVKQEIDATGMAVAPGFINMLSGGMGALFQDGKGQSDTREGVTLEIFGEGGSAGPLSAKMKAGRRGNRSDRIDTSLTTLAHVLKTMENKVTPNIASFVGATTIRQNVLESDDRAPTPAEMEQMKQLVRQAMREGALRLGSALIYPPGFFAKTDELIELAKVVGEYDGMYISHMRSEGNQLLESLDELIRIAKEGKVNAEVYHLKMAGSGNWTKFDAVVKK